MNFQTLQNLGYAPIQRKNADVKTSPSPAVKTVISVQRSTPKNAHLRIKIPRQVLKAMDLEIAQRVKVFFNPSNNTVGIVKAPHNDTTGYVISTQGSSIQHAIDNEFSGLLRIALREDMFEKNVAVGSFDTTMQHDTTTMILQIPETMLAAA